MRHAEKTGDKSDRHLSPPGQQRAAKLASYIPQQFGRPDVLIAAKNSDRSRRPRETLEPLADALGLKIMAAIDDDEVDALIDYLSTDAIVGKFGVISWRHSDIPAVMAALGAPSGSYPEPWPEADFSRIIEISYADGVGPRVREILEPF
jgi:broad specificity phosphatase PhoE